MDNKEILEAMRDINTDMVAIDMLVRRIGIKQKALLSQLGVNFTPELGREVVDSILRAPPVLKPFVDTASSAEARAQPAAVPLQVTDPSLSAVPGASRAAAAAAGVAAQAATALVGSGPAANSQPAPQASLTGGPTRETIPAPTRERQPESQQQRDQRVFQEQLSHFRGTGSLFARHLSPEVITAGKGFLKPELIEDLPQYQDDVLQMPAAVLNSWPMGFYRDSGTSKLQLMIKTPQAIVVVPNLPDCQTVPMVMHLPASRQSQLRAVTDIPLMDLLMLKEAVEGVLNQLSAKTMG